MTAPEDNAEYMNVNGLAVDRKLIASRPVQRCELSECQAHCCSCGVYLTLDAANKILDQKDLVLPHLPPDRRDPEKWFDWIEEPDHDHPEGGTLISTKVVKDSTHPAGQTCVFLRADRKCALQVASIAAGQPPWQLKPFYCSLFPLVFHRRRLILDDENEVYLEGGSCTRPSKGEAVPMFRLFELEMKLAMGEAGYKALETKVHAADSTPDEPPRRNDQADIAHAPHVPPHGGCE